MPALQQKARTHTYRLTEAFRLSRGEDEVTDVVTVRVTAGDLEGWGEACPLLRYEEDVDGALDHLEECSTLLGDDPFAFAERDRRLPPADHHRAARAALDTALHDLCGKVVGMPLWRLLGLGRGGPATSFTICLADPDLMARRSETAARRYRRLKLKLGGLDGLDLARVQAVRRAVDVPLVVDVNEYWGYEEARDLLPALASAGVAFVEQPLPAGHLKAAELTRESPVPLVADEECRTASDVLACVGRYHGVNLKLAKAGGIRETLKAIYVARAAGLRVVIGCMNESSLGVAPAVHLSALADDADLDGHLLLADDPWRGPVFEAGAVLPGAGPGLGTRQALVPAVPGP